MTRLPPEPAVACLLVPHLPVGAEMRRYPALGGRPLVLIKGRGSRQLVLDRSPEAVGVDPGMTRVEALARCPAAVLIQADHRHYRDIHDRIASVLAMRCPWVDADGLGRFYAGLDGMSNIYEGEARLATSLLQVAPGFEPRLGMASGKLSACLAALMSTGGRAARAPRDADGWQANSSIDALPLSGDGKARLRLVGIHTLGRLAATPVDATLAMLEADEFGAEERAAFIGQLASQPIRRAAA